MADVDPTEAAARHIQRDIDRTREEMDHTLTELERRLAPSEILHSSVETVRDRVRSEATSMVDAMKRHPLPVAIALGLLGARFALRPGAAERRRRQTEQDLERTMEVLGAAFEHAQERARVGASGLAELVRDAVGHPDRYATPALRAAERFGRRTSASIWPTVQRAMEESRAMSGALRREAGAYPLGALVLLGLAAGMATIGRRVIVR